MNNDITEIVEKMLRVTGSTYVSLEDLQKRYVNKEELKRACKSHSLCYRVHDFKGKKSFFYTLPHIYKCDKTIAKMVYKRVNTQNLLPYLKEEEVDALLARYQEETGFILDPLQADAVKMAANSHMAIITGGPGTGKTTTLNALRYVEANRSTTKPFEVFLAPTGKAARRMTEAVGIEAHTIQSEIGANAFGQGGVPLRAHHGDEQHR